MSLKIFVADDVSESGLEPLRAASFNVEKRTGLSHADLMTALADCEGLIVRSETKVTAEAMDAATAISASTARRRRPGPGSWRKR